MSCSARQSCRGPRRRGRDWRVGATAERGRQGKSRWDWAVAGRKWRGSRGQVDRGGDSLGRSYAGKGRHGSHGIARSATHVQARQASAVRARLGIPGIGWSRNQRVKAEPGRAVKASSGSVADRLVKEAVARSGRAGQSRCAWVCCGSSEHDTVYAARRAWQSGMGVPGPGSFRHSRSARHCPAVTVGSGGAGIVGLGRPGIGPAGQSRRGNVWPFTARDVVARLGSQGGTRNGWSRRLSVLHGVAVTDRPVTVWMVGQSWQRRVQGQVVRARLGWRHPAGQSRRGGSRTCGAGLVVVLQGTAWQSWTGLAGGAGRAWGGSAAPAWLGSLGLSTARMARQSGRWTALSCRWHGRLGSPGNASYARNGMGGVAVVVRTGPVRPRWSRRVGAARQSRQLAAWQFSSRRGLRTCPELPGILGRFWML